MVQLRLLVVLQPDAIDKIELGLQPVHMLLLILQDLLEQVAADVVLHRLGIGDGYLEVGDGIHLQRKVAAQHLFDGLADAQLAQILQIGQPFEKQHALDQLVGVFHLIDRLVILLVPERLEAPVIVDAGMQEVLVDGNQLIGQYLVEVGNDLGISFHRQCSLVRA